MNQNKKTIKIFIANDHAGFPLKTFLIKNNLDQKWEDLGIFDETPSDYPEQAKILCSRMLTYPSVNETTTFGVLICGSGQGMAIKANRFPGIRATLAWNEKSSCLARNHNDANVLCLGSRLLHFEDAHKIFKAFINTPFKGGRHLNRIKQLDDLL